MCGTDPYGLNSIYSSLFVVLQQLGTGLGKPNDGLVSFGSCTVRDQNSFLGVYACLARKNKKKAIFFEITIRY